MAYGSGGYGSRGYGGTPTLSQRQQYTAQQSAFAAMSPEQQAALIAALRGETFQKPTGGGGESFFGKLVPNIVEKAASQVGDVLLNTPGGLIYAANEIGKDLFKSPDLLHPHGLLTGSNNMPRTTALAKGMAAATYQDFRHFPERPGYALMDLLSLGSLGAGVVGKTAEVGRVARAGYLERAGRLPPTPPDLPPPVRAPRPSPTPPQPGDAGFSAAAPVAESPYSTASLAEVAQRPAYQTTGIRHPLRRGYYYRITDKSGNVMRALYDRTKEVNGRDIHYFRTPEGDVRQIAEHRVTAIQNLTELKDARGRTIFSPTPDMPDLPLPKKGVPFAASQLVEEKPGVFVPKAAAAAKAPGVAAAGQERAAGQFAPKVQEAPPSPGDVELAAAAAEPGPSPAELARTSPKAPPVMPDFGYDPVRKELTAGIGETTRMTAKPIPNSNRWVILHYEKGQQVGEPMIIHADTAQEAGRIFKREAIIKANPTRGGEIPSFAQAYIKAPVRALVSPLPTKTRSVEYFKPQAPQYLTPKAAKRLKETNPEEYARLQNLEATYPAEKRMFQSAPAEHPEKGIELAPEAQMLPRNVVERQLPRTSLRTPGERVLDTGTIIRSDVMLSRNPGAALATNMWVDLMERFPELRVGPYGRKLATYVNFNKAEHDRAAGALVAARKAGIQKQVDDFEALRKSGVNTDVLKRALDSMNILAKIWLLYLKPSYYVANLMGQSWLTLVDHAWSPTSVVRAVRVQWELYGKDRQLAGIRAYAIRHGMGEMMGVSLRDQAHGFGIMENLRSKLPATAIRGHELRGFGSYKSLAAGANKVLDTPFRDNAFIHEAMRHGYGNAEKIGKLIDDAIAGDPTAEAKFLEIARRANKNIIDYARMGKWEKQWVRRIIFFYPWMKGATIYAGHMALEHPAQAFIQTRLGYYGKGKTEQLLGPVPSFMKGVVAVGHRNIPGLGREPTIINPAAVTVLGTPGQVINAGTNFVAGGGSAADQVSQFLTPGLSAGIAAATHKDPFTGKDYPAQYGGLDIIKDQLSQSVAVSSFLQHQKTGEEIRAGTKDPSQVLFPYAGPLEAAGRFFIGPTPYSVNQGEARSRAFAEQTSLVSRRQREILKNKDYHDQYLAAGQKAGIFQQMPPDLAQAFRQRALLSADVAAFEAQNGGQITMLQRLEATVGVLVRQGQMTPEDARTLLLQMSQLPDSAIESYKSKLTSAYFGGEVISRYRAALNASGAGLTVP